LDTYSTDSSEATTIVQHLRGFANSKGFGFARYENVAILFPYWFPTLVFTFLAFVLGFRRARRFRLRSLLIVTTLFAVVLWMMTCP
jgi:lipopolysaccharide export LptBFGC system permease protein LptF